MDTEDCLEVAQTYMYIVSVWTPSIGLLLVCGPNQNWRTYYQMLEAFQAPTQTIMHMLKSLWQCVEDFLSPFRNFE